MRKTKSHEPKLIASVTVLQHGRAALGFDCVSRTHPGLKRKVNEDSILVRTDRGFWAVADGMGGHEAGDVASAKVVEALALVPPHSAMESFVGDSISALQTANSELIRLAQTTQRPRTIGTTIVGLVISGGRFGCFWAGDSRAYRIRDGEIAQLTRDHSLVQGLVDAGMLDPAEAEDHPNANVVTRAVGASEALDVDTSTGDAYAGDTFLLASDGLTRVVSDDEIYSELTQPIDSAADSLLRTVLSRGAPDNVSLILVRLS
jgi:serine/threonine protein phosphatase Stp1